MRFLRDANSFVASSRAAIEWSAPHIYLSALPFAPKDSLIFQDHASSFSGVVSVETVGIDRHGGRLVMNLTGHEGEVISVAYSPNGRLLASASKDDTVRLWDTLTGEETITPLQSDDDTVQCVAFTADGQRVVSGTGTCGLIQIWDVRTGRDAMPPLRGHSGRVWSVALSRDGRLIASASADRSIRLWDAATGDAIAVLTGHEQSVYSVVFSTDGRTLVSGSLDSTIRLWDVRTCKPQGQPLRGASRYVLSVAFSPDDNFIVAQYLTAPGIRIWNVTTGEEIGAPIESESASVGIAFAPDGSCLALTSGHNIRICNWKTNQDVAPELSGHANAVMALSYSPDGFHIASGSRDHTIRIWDVKHSNATADQLPSHNDNINSVAVSADGSFIVSGSIDGTIRVWNSQTSEMTLPPLVGHRDEVLSVAVSVDGQLIASGSADHTIRLWNATTGEPIGVPLEGHTRRITAVTFSHDARWLASASFDETVGLWALGGDQRPTLHQLPSEHEVFSVAFSSNSRFLAFGDYAGYITMWSLSNDGNHTMFTQMGPIFFNIISVCFSPDDSKIAAASSDYNIYIWDVKTKLPLHALEGHKDCVRAVAYSPDGERLVSGGDDHIVRIWDANVGEAVVALHVHGAAVRSVAFMPDGKSFVSGAEDGTIRSWDLLNAQDLSSRFDLSPVDMLGLARQEDGWLVGASKERLIWLPREYRPIVVTVVGRDITALLASRRVVLSAGLVLHHGEEWTKCWRRAKSSTSIGSS